MSQNRQVVQHRLGIARKALKGIIDHRPYMWEEDRDIINSLKYIAESALEDMDRETDKSRKRREAEQRVYIERVAREVAKEVDR